VIYYDVWRSIPADQYHDPEFVLQETINDLNEAGLTLSDIPRFVWVFDLKPEGVSANDMQCFFQLFSEHGLEAKNFRVVYSCVEQVDTLPYPAVCLPDRLIYNGNWWMHMDHYHIPWDTLEMTHQLVCLMRRPSLSRAHLAKRLLSKFNPSDIVMTFGTNGMDTSEEIKKLIWPHPYPMIVDRPMADQVFQHRINHDKFYRAPVNLVVESSSQTDPNTWRSHFITEKTFKALAWHQFPIWYAVPGFVSQVRDMGFDVFDDVLDNHFYDLIEDPWARMTQVVMLAKKVCSQDLVKLREQHWHRLQNNAQLIKEIHTTALDQHTEQINRLIHGNF
jgi:hypothetical protein